MHGISKSRTQVYPGTVYDKAWISARGVHVLKRLYTLRKNDKNLLLPLLPGLLYNAPFVAITGQFANNVSQNQPDNHR
jgi:hypothetical protein